VQLGPVKPPSKSRYQNPPEGHVEEPGDIDQDEDEDEDEDEDPGSASSSNDADDTSDSEQGGPGSRKAEGQEPVLNDTQDRSSKKRKRGGKDVDVEGAYLQKLAREEAKEEEKQVKKQRTTVEGDAIGAEESDEDSFTIPKHETLAMPSVDNELEKAERTVFLGNVSSEAITSKVAEKQLKQHLSSFIPDLADSKPPHKVESIRFRSTAFAGSLPKRAAFAKKEVMESTTKSTNAYVVYTTKVAAREAVKRLNGTIVLGRHLRLDWVAHPSQVDHRRCVFVGNLGFVDDESNMNASDEKKKNKSTKPPSDVEEGLWVHFAKAGKIESVRVPRDAKTRVGKGFAYVQFEDENSVEAALQFNDQKFPPLLPRKLRVVRAKAQKRKDKKMTPAASRSPASNPKGAYNAKIPEEEKSKQGRARAVLGKAAAFKSAEAFVFEGHRASSKQGTSGLKLGGKKKGPNGRKSRSKAWKANGGKRS